jgi:elongation factor P
MALLEYNEIKEGKIIVYNGEPCEVLEAHVARTQQRKPQNQTKLKSLVGGRTYNETFQGSDTVEEAEIEKREIKFLYANRGEYWFSDPNDPKNRFKLDEKILGEKTLKFLKENTIATALIFDNDGEEQMIGVKLPIKMDFKIKDAPPAIKGNTASGGNKPVTLENGAVVNVPLFIEAGETIRVNTETGEYYERVS